MGVLRKVLLVPQLKKDLILEEQLAREMDWSVNAKDTWKRVINNEGELLMEGRIVDRSNLYVTNPAYFVYNEEACQVDPATESD